MSLFTSFVFKHFLVICESSVRELSLPFIPNLYHSALNLKYHRGIQIHDHFIINYQKSQYSSSTRRETQQTLFHLRRIWSRTAAFCQLCLCKWEEEHLSLFNRLFLRQGLGVQHPAKFPISFGEKPFVFWNCKSARQSPHRNSPHENTAVLYLNPQSCIFIDLSLVLFGNFHIIQ